MQLNTDVRDSLESSPAGGALDSEKDEMSPIDNEPQLDLEAARITVSKEAAASDWTGPTDPDNPQNWSKWFRKYHIVPPALISFTA
jgi:hypothetical protein